MRYKTTLPSRTMQEKDDSTISAIHYVIGLIYVLARRGSHSLCLWCPSIIIKNGLPWAQKCPGLDDVFYQPSNSNLCKYEMHMKEDKGMTDWEKVTAVGWASQRKASAFPT